jgi:hypothetical protein
MPSNKIVLRTTDELNSGFKPVYRPIWGLFMGNARQYTAEAGTHSFREVKTVGDIRVKQITPKDTELKQIAVSEGSKTFKKYFHANQFIQSSFQDQEGVQDIINQVLDEHNKQADDLLLGDGTNSGLFTSSDANYQLESSAEVAKDADDGSHVADLYAKIMSLSQTADQNAGRKLVLFYGANVLPKVKSLFKASTKPFNSVLAEGLGPNYSLATLPSDVTPASSHGLMIINMDQILLHWTAMPQLQNRGLNEEKNYYWFNFLLGSMMVDCRVAKAIIRQPVTFAA